MGWIVVLLVVGVLLLASWLVDRRGASGSTSDRATRQAHRDLGQGDLYRFLRKG
jgi:hypothetical protein